MLYLKGSHSAEIKKKTSTIIRIETTKQKTITNSRTKNCKKDTYIF